MALPFSFLLGLLVVAVHRELEMSLPGEATVETVALGFALLTIPLLLALVARRQATRVLTTGRSPLLPPRALLRLSAIGTPLALHALFAFGHYGDCVARLAPLHPAAQIGLVLLPLYLLELPRLAVSSMAEVLVEVAGDSHGRRALPTHLLPSSRDVWPTVRLRFAWPILVLMPAAMLGLARELLVLERDVYVLVFATSFGLSLATIAFLITAAIVLPLWFRVAFPLQRTFPEPAGSVLRSAAMALGFAPRRLFVVRTGMRALNAMMVGPLPIGRLLGLTDGLLAALDPRALTGVLAHEIGHARMGHPGMLMAVAVLVPMGLMAPLHLLDLDDADVVLQATIAAVAVIGVWGGIRWLARRFEHEADVESVRHFGAGPCSDALRKVTSLGGVPTHSVRSRILSLHPDERQRLVVMHRYEQDPAFRQQFDQQSRRLRIGFFGVVLLVVAVAAWFWRVQWRYEQVLVRFHTGDFVAAQRLLDQIGEPPTAWQEPFERIRAELAIGLELVPEARTWRDVEHALEPIIWARAEQQLLEHGPEAARPWTSLAISVLPQPTTVQYAIDEYCEAAAANDPERMRRLAAIVRRLGVPRSLTPVFAAG